MLRLLQIFLLLIAGNVFTSPQSAIVECQATHSIEPSGKEHNHPSDIGSITAAGQQSAIVNTQRNNVRTLTSRTQRTTSSHGTSKWRGGWGYCLNTYNHNLTYQWWKAALAVVSAPFRCACPCDYYVIALRHIIR